MPEHRKIPLKMPLTASRSTKAIDRTVHALALTVILFTVQQWALPIRPEWILKALKSLGIESLQVSQYLTAVNAAANSEEKVIPTIAILGVTVAACYLLMHGFIPLLNSIRNSPATAVIELVITCVGVCIGFPLGQSLRGIRYVWKTWLKKPCQKIEEWMLKRIFFRWAVRVQARREARISAESEARGEARGEARVLNQLVQKGIITPEQKAETEAQLSADAEAQNSNQNRE